MNSLPPAVLTVFPETAQVNDRNHLVLGGLDVTELAAEYGTPLYVFDEATLQGQCATFVAEFKARYPDTSVLYASKALSNQPILRIMQQQGLGLDVVSVGELAIAKAAEFPMDRVYFHGNNKGAAELSQALEWGIGRVVVDNFHELRMLDSLAESAGRRQDILLRISPGVDPHTHHHTTTGILDSKFGFALANGDAEEAVRIAQAAGSLDLIGVHAHLGSPIFEVAPYREAIGVIFDFAAEMRDRHGLELKEFSPGGGFPIQYTVDQPAPPLADYAETITTAVRERAEALGFDPPHLFVEPGRAIVGRSGVALYEVGAIKDIPGVRKYVSVDGGMGDNIRPAIYGSRYEAVAAGRVNAKDLETVTLAGKYCESGDVLVKDVDLPKLSPGDIVAIPASGAYCIPMASNYNANPRPALVLVSNGDARLIQRRETLEELMQRDVL
jgi:diaminopimelate decarboxylase